MLQLPPRGVKVRSVKRITKPLIKPCILGKPLFWACVFPKLNHTLRGSFSFNVAVERHHVSFLGLCKHHDYTIDRLQAAGLWLEMRQGVTCPT